MSPIRVLLSLLVLVATISFPAHAAKKKPGVLTNLDEVALVNLPNGSKVWCYSKDGVSAHGKVVDRRGSLYFIKETLAQKMAVLNAQKDNLTPKVYKKKKKKIKDDFNEKVNTCAYTAPGSGPGSQGPDVSLIPLSRAPTAEDIRYLLEKTGFGVSPKEEPLLAYGLQNGLAAAVNEYLRVKAEGTEVTSRAPDRIDETIGSSGTPSFRGIRQAWMDIFLETNNPFYEKFALFLLSVWTVGEEVLTDTEQRILIWDYITLLRQTAQDPNLRTLAVNVAHHPMMLLYLDGATNFKSSPNENFARELLELFTTGPRDLDGYSNYTETPGDISKLARRLTGWRVIEVAGTGGNQWIPVYSPSDHATGPETLFAGTAHACSADTDTEVIDCLFRSHPNVANYYASELLKFYVTPQPPRALVENFAAIIKKNNFHLLEPMRILLNSEAFYHKNYRDTLAKNSLEYAVEVVRTLDMPVAITGGGGIEEQVARMEMAITKSPTVFWWDNSTWTSPPVNLEKANFLARIIRDRTTQRGPDAMNPLWTPAQVLPPGSEVLPREVVNFVANKLGVPITTDREDTLVHYMMNNLGTGGSYVPYSYDHRIEDSQRKKALGLYYILALSPAFQLK